MSGPILWSESGDEAFVPLKRDADGKILQIPIRYGQIKDGPRTPLVIREQERVGLGWKLAGCAMIIGMWEIGCYLGRVVLGWLA